MEVVRYAIHETINSLGKIAPIAAVYLLAYICDELRQINRKLKK